MSILYETMYLFSKLSFSGFMQTVAWDYRPSIMYASMSTPSFSPNLTRCITFNYTIFHEKPILSLYIRSKHYMLSGRKIWSSSGSQTGPTSVTVWNNTLQKETQLDFISVLMAIRFRKIVVSNVIFSIGKCENTSEVVCLDSEFRCSDHQKCITVEAICNGTSECSDSSDEEPPVCGE